VDVASLDIEEQAEDSEQVDWPTAAGEGPDLGFLSQPSARERQAVWLAASRWSLSAAMFAKGAEETQWRRAVEGAQAAADEIALRLPAMPVDPQDRVEAVIHALSDAPNSLAEQIAAAVQRRTNAEEAATARLAIRANLLLLTYSPQNGRAAQQAHSLRALAEASSISEVLWNPLVEALEAGVDFASLKQAVFSFHRRVTASLTTQPASRSAETLLGDFLRSE
jgi:hypothetical protein